MYKFLSFLLLIIWYKWNMDNYFYLNMDRHFSNTLIKKQKKKTNILYNIFFNRQVFSIFTIEKKSKLFSIQEFLAETRKSIVFSL